MAAHKKPNVSTQLPAGLRKILKHCPEPTDPAALEFAAAILMVKIKAAGDALDAVVSRGDPDEILIACARTGRDLREDATVLRQIQQSLIDIAAAKTTAPRDYRTETTVVTIEDGAQGLRVVRD